MASKDESSLVGLAVLGVLAYLGREELHDHRAYKREVLAAEVRKTELMANAIRETNIKTLSLTVGKKGDWF